MSVPLDRSVPTLWDLAEIVQEETEKVLGEQQMADIVSTEILIRFIQGHVTNMRVVELPGCLAGVMSQKLEN